jgi:hypothetical protein
MKCRLLDKGVGFNRSYRTKEHIKELEVIA